MSGSSKKLTPVRGGGQTRWVERGRGVNTLEDARHSSVLYICKYFVVRTDWKCGFLDKIGKFEKTVKSDFDQ